MPKTRKVKKKISYSGDVLSNNYIDKKEVNNNIYNDVKYEEIVYNYKESLNIILGISHKKVPIFLKKLWIILDPEENNYEGISWDNKGEKIKINSIFYITTKILPKYFRHNKFSSFQRQLNYYGFKNIKNIETSNLNFNRYQPYKTLLIIRRTNNLIFNYKKIPTIEIPKQEIPKQEIPKQEIPKKKTPKQEIKEKYDFEQRSSLGNELENNIISDINSKFKTSINENFQNNNFNIFYVYENHYSNILIDYSRKYILTPVTDLNTPVQDLWSLEI